jgi:hypothetical protein
MEQIYRKDWPHRNVVARHSSVRATGSLFHSIIFAILMLSFAEVKNGGVVKCPLSRMPGVPEGVDTKSGLVAAGL